MIMSEALTMFGGREFQSFITLFLKSRSLVLVLAYSLYNLSPLNLVLYKLKTKNSLRHGMQTKPWIILKVIILSMRLRL